MGSFGGSDRPSDGRALISRDLSQRAIESRNNYGALPLGSKSAGAMSIVQVENRGTTVSVTFSLQTPQQAKELTELIAGQLREGELHLRIGAKAHLVIGVPQGGDSFKCPPPEHGAGSTRKVR